VSDGGELASWKIGQSHIKKVLGTFGCRCVDLLDRSRAEPEVRHVHLHFRRRSKMRHTGLHAALVVAVTITHDVSMAARE
jgi:hypothetical protein